MRWSLTLVSVVVNTLSQVQISNSDGLIFKSTRPGRSAQIPDLYKKTPDFVLSFGYPVETHEVTTEDGYILNIHRVPYGKYRSQIPGERKPAVLLQHGIGGASDNWFLVGAKSFPFVLADNGYDVWILNTRGNSYSKRHKTKTLSKSKYWDFSFHEQGVYDLAASIDYALLSSRQDKLFYVGHSRGTTSSLVLLSMRPEYNNKIRLLINYAPVAYLKDAKGPILRALIENVSPRQAKKMLDTININAFPSLTKPTLMFRTQLCGRKSTTFQLCVRFLKLLNGENGNFINMTAVPTYFTHFPDGGGVKEILHYIQIARTDRFSMYDFGKDNFHIYGSSLPPEYPLERITAPISFHLSHNDFFVSRSDFEKLSRRINNVVGEFYVPHPIFNHADFVWGTGADELLYKPTIELMRRF